MKHRMFLAVLLNILIAPVLTAQQSLDVLVNRELPQLVSTYKTLHAAPELSHYEAKTSAFVAQQLRMLGYTVTENIGKYDQPNWKGYGVVALMKNGDGPTVWVRTELDALPSKKKQVCPMPARSRRKTMRDRKPVSCTRVVTTFT